MITVKETLEHCSLKLQELSGSIDRIRSLKHSDNSIDLTAPPPTPTSPTTMTGKRAAARCHECHGPLAGYHQGYPHGLGVCQLEHYDLCPGGVQEKDKGGHVWNVCPPEYEPPSETELLSDDEQVSPAANDEHSEVLETREKVIGAESLQTTSGTNDVESNDADGTKTPVTGNPKSSAPKSHIASTVETSGLSQADILLEAELADLAIAEEEEKKLKAIADIRKKKEQSLENIARLTRQAQGEGARVKTSIQSSIDMLRSANHSQSVKRMDNSGYSGPSMNEIRLDNQTRDNVENLMGSVYNIPAFSNASQRRLGQPRLKQTTHTAPPNRRQTVVVKESLQVETGPEDAEKLYKWVVRRDQYGQVFKELVEASPERPSAPRQVVSASPGWYYDEQTNRMYRNLSPATAPTQSRYLDSRREGSTPVRQQQRVIVDRTPAVVRDDLVQFERVPGIVPLASNSSEDREGKIPLSIASHARNLPMEYARSATSKNMNFAVFMYGAIHELHSSRIGISPAMPKGVLEAKLQHLKNVIHVTCLNASSSDFKPAAWLVGRTYHNLVQAKVDSGREDWIDFDMLHRGSPHAAEMIAAEREHRQALLAKPEKIVAKKTDKRDEKQPCPTWNEYEVEGKCKYEAEHPGEKCNRSHNCSFCKKKYPATRTFHQARFCKRKQEEDS